uniref:Protein phosphatase methylesterase 1 n=1 Tax=Macrostomum lignano TaxID=282301 RepID=A0A1I8IIP4_9PLAT
ALRGLPNRAPLPPKAPSATSQHGVNPQCFDPLPWETYFDKRDFARVERTDCSGSFCYYVKETRPEDAANAAHNDMPASPGGISAPPVQSPPLVFLLHGGGFSGLSWAAMSASLVGKVVCRCVSFDIRGHGDKDDGRHNDMDFSLDALTNDAASVLNCLLESSDFSAHPRLVCMGGAIATHLAYSGLCPLPVCALVVIDVVEGSAMEALSSMRGYLASRPISRLLFSGAIGPAQCITLDSARVSFPGHLKLVNPSERQQQKQKDQEEPKQPPADNRPSYRSAQQVDPTQPYYTWRIDLSSTESHWSGWFHGMSRKFLEVPAAKMLLLAGVDRLDRELTVGQMQGKFQMQLLHRSGHAVHEDHPEHVAEVLASFLVRHKLARALADFHPAPPGC